MPPQEFKNQQTIKVILILGSFLIPYMLFGVGENEASGSSSLFEVIENDSTTVLNQVTRKELIQQFTSLEKHFTENQGQINNVEVKYYYQGQDFQAAFTPHGVVFVFQQHDQDSLSKHPQVIRLCFEGAFNIIPQGLELISHHTNFFQRGNEFENPVKAPNFSEILYRGLYPRIDLKYKFDDEGSLKYEFIVHPGGDPNQIRMRYDGESSLQVEKGSLTVKVGVLTLYERDLFIYHKVGGKIIPILGQFVSRGRSSYGFKLNENYSLNSTLVIDPIIEFSTYFGGNRGDEKVKVAIDSQGNAYVTGYTQSSNFLTTPRVFDTTYNGNFDAFVAKISKNGSTLEYSTFLGGTADDRGIAIAVDSNGKVYVTGRTRSSDFPTTPGAFERTLNGSYDIFVTKIGTNGSTLEYSTLLGGNSSDLGEGIAIDSSGNAYITGHTDSPDFPTTLGAFDTTHNNELDVIVTKLSADGSRLLYSTFIGGSSHDYGYGITVDTNNQAYITGWLTSSDFPTTPGAFDTTLNGYTAVFVLKLSVDGSNLVYSTLLDGGLFPYGIEVDYQGNAYIAGYTTSSSFPTTPGVFDTTRNGIQDVFITKVSANGSTLEYSTYLGSPGVESVNGITVDDSGIVYITGVVISAYFPTTPDAFNHTLLQGESELFMTRLSQNGSNLLFSTMLGGSREDEGHGIAVDPNGIVYITGHTTSIDFPTTSGVLNNTALGNYDFDGVVVKISFDMVPDALESLQATVGRNHVNLSWTPPTSDGGANITGYKVYRGTKPESLFVIASLNATTLNYTDLGLIGGYIHFYEVRAINNVGEGIHMSTANETRLPVPYGVIITLDSPINRSSILNSTSIELQITDPDLDVALYHWDSEPYQTFESPFDVPPPDEEGWHLLYVYANDTSGRETFQVYEFYVDSTPPFISVTGLENNTISFQVQLNISVTDLYLDKVWYAWDDSQAVQNLSSPYFLIVSVTEGWHYLHTWANDTLGHMTHEVYRIWVNHPPMVTLLNISNQSVIIPTNTLTFHVEDANLSVVQYQWNTESVQSIQAPYIIKTINSSGWHDLTIDAFDAHGALTKVFFRFYIIHPETLQIQEEDFPKLTYEGENFEFTFKITNLHEVPLNLTLYAHSEDDEILKGNGTMIFLTPGESYNFTLEVRPRHASPHNILVRLFNEEDLFKEYTFSFEVEPFYLSPRVLGPLITMLLVIVLLSILVVSSVFIKGKMEERDRLKWVWEQIRHKGSIELEVLRNKFTENQLSKLTDSLEEHSFQVEDKLVDPEWLKQEVQDITIQKGSVTVSEVATKLKIPEKMIIKTSDIVSEAILYKRENLLSIEIARKLVIEQLQKEPKKRVISVKAHANKLGISQPDLRTIITSLLKSQQILGVMDYETFIWLSLEDIAQIRVNLELSEVTDITEFAEKEKIPVELFRRFLKEVVKPKGFFSEDGKFISERSLT